MSRTVSLGFRASLYARESGETCVCLLTFEHATLAEPMRISTDPTARLTDDPVTYGTTSRGNVYSFVGVAVTLPEDINEGGSRARLEIDNTDRGLINLIRSIAEPATVTMELVLSSNPDIVEVEFAALTLGAVQYDASKISFELESDTLFHEPYPGTAFLPSRFPGLF